MDIEINPTNSNWRLANFITGERLQGLCEITVSYPNKIAGHKNCHQYIQKLVILSENIHEPPILWNDSVETAKLIFVYPDCLEQFKKWVLPKIRTEFTLVSHNSDFPFGNKHMNLLNYPLVRHIFAQNIDISHPKLSGLPIGIANSQWPHGNLAVLNEICEIVWSVRGTSTKDKLLHSNFSLHTNSDRKRIREILAKNGFSVQSPNLSYRDYLIDLSGYRFAVSPLGNGIDCHRTWECLYLGVIPIVQEHIHNQEFSSGLPICMISDWNDITPEWLEEKYGELSPKFQNLDMLWLSYWKKRFTEESN